MTMSQYYYLVAGLPDVVLDDGAFALTFSDFTEDMAEHIEAEDVALLRTICLPVDNANLISIIENSDRPFVPGGNFSREELEAQISRPDNVPDYMQIFLEARRDSRTLFENCTAADGLNWLFYDQMSEHPNEFIREWFSFELNLRNVLAGINSRRGLAHLEERGVDPSQTLSTLILCRTEVSELIMRSGAPDFGLTALLPWVEGLVAASHGGLQEFEKTVDALRWEILDHLTVLSGFGVESILAAALRIGMAERWAKLDPETGREKIKTAVAQLKSGFQIPAEFARTR